MKVYKYESKQFELILIELKPNPQLKKSKFSYEFKILLTFIITFYESRTTFNRFRFDFHCNS